MSFYYTSMLFISSCERPHSRAAIPRFSIRIRMRISIHMQKISMRTPYSTFQYPIQDAYQYPYGEDFNADTLFHVSVSVKRICLFNNTLNSAYFKMLGRYLYTLIISHKSRNMVSILNKL